MPVNKRPRRATVGHTRQSQPITKRTNRMRITKIKLDNVKGITVEHRLEPLTIITGRNGSGKTAVALGLKLGLTGYLPTLGKTAQSLYKLAGNPDKPGRMSITLVTEPHGVIHHEWTRNDKGAVSYDGSIPSDVRWPDSMLDFRRFLSLPGAEQAAELFKRCGSDAKPADWLDTLDTITGIRPEVVRHEVDRIKADLGAPRKNLAEWIEDSQATLKQWVKQWSSEEKRLSAMLQAHIGAKPDGKTRDVSAELSEAKKELQGEIDKLAGHTNAWRKYERELAVWQVRKQNWEEAGRRINAEYEEKRTAADTKIDEVESMTACPTCGAQADGWQIKWIEDIAKTLDDAQIAFSAVSAAHASNKPGKKPTKPGDAPAEVQKRIDELGGKVNALQIEKNKQDAAESWRGKRNQLELEASEATCRAEVLKECVKRLTAWRDELIDGGIGKILAVANQFWDGVATYQMGPLAWNKERAEFGRDDGDGWISLDTFSGFEEQLAFAALSVAVSSGTPVKLVIMDELGRMTQANKINVIARMDWLIAKGIIDQFVGLDVSAEDYRYLEDVKGAKVVTL